MATGVQQVTEDYEQLKELLELYPKISIVKTEGQPPDSYEIEYNLCGYVKNEEDETIGIGQSHRVRLSLPFGYPHFAPVAKPLTPIFHPDFDPAAIRLTDHWQQNPSLPELVLYIGEMICGNVYNLKDSFNQEAAEWYEGQQDQLPLDTVSVADIEAMDSPLDSLDDALIALGDDDRIPLGLEQEPVAAPLPSVDNAELQHIRDLVKKNKIFAANRLLSELPAGVSFADREGMQLHIGKVFRKVDQLFKTVEQLLSMSRLAEAMELVDEIKTLAADAPGADALKKKIQQAMPAAASAARAPGRAKSTAAASKPSSPVKLASKSLGWPGTLPVKPIVAAILILAVAILTISLYFKDQSSLSQSQARLLQGQELIGQKQFDQALETLEGAKAILSDLTILRFRKTTQEKTIDNLISSSEMQEGLQGRVLYEGEFIPLSVAASLEELAELPARAQALVEQNKIEAALALYRQALKFATDHNLDKQQALFGEAIQSLELRNALDEAEKAEKKNDWDEAAESYRKALNLSDQMMQLSTTGDIASRMAVASFRHELDQSKKAFSQSQWKETVQYLERAQQTLDANPGIVSEKERQEFHQLLVNSRLYFMLSTAREAYQQKKWAQAIDDYQSALKLLTKEAGDTGNLRKESQKKIEKTLLMVKIAQLQDQILKDEGRGNPTVILSRYKEILRLIKDSAHQDDPAVKDVAQKVSEKIEKQQETLLQRENVVWLEENFEEIFRANYPTFKGSTLSQPKAVYVKKIGSRMVFTLTCIERSPGSSAKLALNYQFDTTNGRWSVYND